MALGDAFIDVHANTRPFESDLKRDLEGFDKDADSILNKIGEHWGQTLSNSTSKELEKHGKDFGRAMEKATQSITVKVRSKFDIDNNVIRDSRGRFARRLVDGIEEEISDAIRSAASPGGPFSLLGTAIRDAIGAGFNISGKSPLVSFLIPLVGFVVALVAAALQAVNAVVAVVATLPALLFAVGFQAAIVITAFHGMGEAIQGALAAKNAKELNEAIKDLTPSAQDFVRQIVGAREAFKEIQKITQESFFRGLGNIIGPLMSIFTPSIQARISNLARDLGEFFRGIALFFASQPFRDFLTNVLPATGKFLDRFGPSFVTFLTGLIKFANASLPFLTALGGIASNIFEDWGKDLEKLAGDKSLQQWFADMEDTLQSVRDLFGAVVDFVAVFLAQLNKQGGVTIIDKLAEAFDRLTFFLSTPVGEEALRGIVELSIVAIEVVFGLVMAFLAVIAAVNFAIRAIGAFFEWIGGLIMDLIHAIGDFFKSLGNAIERTFEGPLAFIRSIPDKIIAVFNNAKNLLFGAGKNIIGGLISGIKDAIPAMVDALKKVAAMIPENKGPEDKDRQLLVPAGKAVMEGFATGLQSGAENIRDMLSDFTSSMGRLGVNGGNGGGITFGRDSIRISFEGALPTEEQAMTTGSAVGSGISSALARRNTRLAVRTL